MDQKTQLPLGVTEYVCKDTGRVLLIKKIPFTVTDALYKRYDEEHTPPVPPMNKVDFGEGDVRDLPNFTHPEYVRLLRDHEVAKRVWVNEKAQHVFTELAVECEVDTEAVKKLRDYMTSLGCTLDSSDKFVYVWDICVGTQEGYNDLFEAIQRRSRPTESVIQDTLTRFPTQGKRN